MDDAATNLLFRRLDRAFWLIWLGFPLLIWTLVRNILTTPERIAELSPDHPECLENLRSLATLTPLGNVVFWLGFGIEFTVYALLLALAHWVIHRCATGRVFVAEMIGVLRTIGLVIACWPVCNLVMQNLTEAALVATGDLPQFGVILTLDLPVLGVGLLMVTLALAMKQAVQLREDADLTI